MGVYKEEAHEFEMVAKQQHQLYPDAADFGVRVLDPEIDGNVKRIQRGLAGLKDSLKITREFVDYETGKTSTTKVFIPWEQEGDLFLGTLYTIEYIHTKPEYRGKKDTDYISIYMERHSQTENPFLN